MRELSIGLALAAAISATWIASLWLAEVLLSLDLPVAEVGAGIVMMLGLALPSLFGPIAFVFVAAGLAKLAWQMATRVLPAAKSYCRCLR